MFFSCESPSLRQIPAQVLRWSTGRSPCGDIPLFLGGFLIQDMHLWLGGCMVNPDGQFASFQRREVPDICARLQWVDLICTMLNLEDHESRMHFGRASVTRDVFWRRYRRSDDGRVNTLELQTSMVTHHKLLKGLSLWYVATISGRAQPEDPTRRLFNSLTSRPLRIQLRTITGVVWQVLVICNWKSVFQSSFFLGRVNARNQYSCKNCLLLSVSFCDIWLLWSRIHGSSGSRKRHCEVHEEVFRHKRPEPQTFPKQVLW